VRDHLTLPAGVRREVVAADVETFLFTYSPELIVVSTSAGMAAKGMLRYLEDMTRQVRVALRVRDTLCPLGGCL
jgi:enamine deaminase RidA (YjgF/YER057c/UK114 family)